MTTNDERTTLERAAEECRHCEASGAPMPDIEGGWAHLSVGGTFGVACDAEDIWNTDGPGEGDAGPVVTVVCRRCEHNPCECVDAPDRVDLIAALLLIYGHCVNRKPAITAPAGNRLAQIQAVVINTLGHLSVEEIERRAKGDPS